MDKAKQIKSIILKTGLERILEVIERVAKSDKLISDCLKELVMLESEPIAWYKDEYKKIIKRYCK